MSEQKSLPVLFLLTIQHSSDIILPKYINIIGSRNIWVNSPDICKTFQIFRKWTKDKKNREVQSQHQEPNDQLHHRHSQDNDMESHASTSEGNSAGILCQCTMKCGNKDILLLCFFVDFYGKRNVINGVGFGV